MPEGKYIKQNVKDSVFTDFFRDPKNVFKLFTELHPEATDVSETDVDIITLTNVMVNEMYNDLGFIVRDRLIILVEAQTTWTINIIPRVLLYLGETLKEYFERVGANLYGTAKVNVPQVEAHVIYAGPPKSSVKNGPISLKNEFYGGVASGIDLTVNVICSSRPGSLIGQYIAFCQVINEQVKQFGRTKEAITSTLKICMEKNILKEYLKSKEMEVLDMMTNLFDQEKIFNIYVEEEKSKAAKEAAEKAAKETAEKVAKEAEWKAYTTIFALKGKLSAEEISAAFKIPLQKVLEILSGENPPVST